MKCSQAVATAQKILECCTNSSGSILTPNASTSGGGAITNTDSYAPGDNRVPKSLFKRIIRRRLTADEDEETLAKLSDETLDKIYKEYKTPALVKRYFDENGMIDTMQLEKNAEQRGLPEWELYMKEFYNIVKMPDMDSDYFRWLQRQPEGKEFVHKCLHS